MSEKKIKTNYSIVSRGTEKYNNHGYMSITENINGYRYLQNIDHNILYSKIDEYSVKFKDNYTIENMSLSRFELIFELAYKRLKRNINENILIIGLGNIGFGTLIGLIKHNYQRIDILVKNKREYILKTVNIINRNFNLNISLLTYDDVNFENYNSIFECSGSSDSIMNVIRYCSYHTNIFILSTPKDDKYLINPLSINRKNINLFGGHEFNGILKSDRDKIYKNLLRKNNKLKFLENVVSIYPYSKKKLKMIKKQKNNIIEVFEY